MGGATGEGGASAGGSPDPHALPRRYLTADIPGTLLAQCDVTNEADLSALFGQLKESWGSLDYIVHAIAFAPRPAMDGRYIETRRQRTSRGSRSQRRT